MAGGGPVEPFDEECVPTSGGGQLDRGHVKANSAGEIHCDELSLHDGIGVRR